LRPISSFRLSHGLSSDRRSFCHAATGSRSRAIRVTQTKRTKSTAPATFCGIPVVCVATISAMGTNAIGTRQPSASAVETLGFLLDGFNVLLLAAGYRKHYQTRPSALGHYQPSSVSLAQGLLTARSGRLRLDQPLRFERIASPITDTGTTRTTRTIYATSSEPHLLASNENSPSLPRRWSVHRTAGISTGTYARNPLPKLSHTPLCIGGSVTNHGRRLIQAVAAITCHSFGECHLFHNASNPSVVNAAIGR